MAWETNKSLGLFRGGSLVHVSQFSVFVNLLLYFFFVS